MSGHGHAPILTGAAGASSLDLPAAWWMRSAYLPSTGFTVTVCLIGLVFSDASFS